MARHLRRASSSEGISLISSFEAQGLWGQYIYVCPKTKVVIVRTASKWGSIGSGGWNQVLRYIATHLGESPTDAASPRAPSAVAP